MKIPGAADVSEGGLETLIVTAMAGKAATREGTTDSASGEAAGTYAGTGWALGRPEDYNREYAVDLVPAPRVPRRRSTGRRRCTRPGQRGPRAAEVSGPAARRDHQARRDRRAAQGHQARPAASSTSSTARPRRATRRPATRFAANRFSVTRQLRYSRDETQLALDLALFINGLPVATFELKNSLTKQTVDDAVEQYKRDRDPRELLFQFGRCVVHFAVDDSEVRFARTCKGKGSWFLPFNQGWNDGAGNPPNPDGLKTDYLWKRGPHAGGA